MGAQPHYYHNMLHVKNTQFIVISGDSVIITLDYKFSNLGAYVYPLVLKLLGSQAVSSYILKELVNI
jgi:hypothetical protein